MPTIAEREERLVQFLEQSLPELRIRPTLQVDKDAAARGLLRAPELRVSLAAIRPEGVLRWRVELLAAAAGGADNARVGGGGLLTLADKLRTAISDSRWRSAGGQATEDALAPKWIEHLDEPWTPAGRTPQSFHALLESAAAIPAASEEGTNQFDDLFLAVDAIEVGDLLIIQDASGLQYLGAVIHSGTSSVQTEHAVRRLFAASSVLLRCSQTLVAEDVASESQSRDLAAQEPVSLALPGHRRKTLIAPETFSLVLRFQGTQLRRSIETYLRTHALRASLLLARADLSMAEVTPVALEWSDKELGHVALTFLASPVGSLVPFTETPP